MNEQYEVAGGSTVGRDHRLIPKNNHDAWTVRRSDDLTVCIVADGCGSGKHSEIGANLGVQLLSEHLVREYSDPATVSWQRAERAVLSHIDILARAMSEDYRKVIENYFLFTYVGVVIGREKSVFFACGDGLIAINDTLRALGPFPGNMPPYLCYQLISENVSIDPGLIRLIPLIEVANEDMDTFMIATDGVDDLLKAQEERMPGLTKQVGPLSQFWSDERYFRGNPEIVSRQLKLIGRDWPRESPEAGLLSDDTTIVVGKRISIERTDS